MKPITAESINENSLRQWLKELTDYTPQQIDQVMERLHKSYNAA